MILRPLILAATLMAVAAPAAAQIDPSNPAGAPLSPSEGPTTKPAQGQVIRDASPGADTNTRNEPRPPSATAGIEEPQRTQSTRAEKGLPPKSPSAQPAPVEQAPGTDGPGL